MNTFPQVAVSSGGVLTPGAINTVDATAGPVSVFLPLPGNVTSRDLIVAKVDSGPNSVIVVGPISPPVGAAILNLNRPSMVFSLVGDQWSGSALSTLDARYDPGSMYGLFPFGWDAAWRAAKQASATTPAWMAVIGDSTDAGQNSGDMMNLNWVELTRNRLAVNYPAYGDFYPMWTYCNQTNTNTAGTPPFSSPSSTGIWEGGYGRAVEIPSGTSTTFTTPRGGVIGMDLVYLDYSAGTFTYTVDGGSAQTVTVVNTLNNYPGAQVKKIAITGLTAGAHTLTVNGASAHTCVILGVSMYYATAGVGVARIAYNGLRAVDWATLAAANTGAGGLPSAPNDKITMLQGQSPGGASPSTATGFGFPTQPSLAVISLGINDCVYTASLKAYESALYRFCAALRRGQANCSFMFIAKSFPNQANSDVALAGNGGVYERYKRTMQSVADSYNGAFIDIDSSWQSVGVGKGFQNTGDLHPTALGYANIDATVGALIAA